MNIPNCARATRHARIEWHKAYGEVAERLRCQVICQSGNGDKKLTGELLVINDLSIFVAMCLHTGSSSIKSIRRGPYTPYGHMT